MTLEEFSNHLTKTIESDCPRLVSNLQSTPLLSLSKSKSTDPDFIAAASLVQSLSQEQLAGVLAIVRIAKQDAVSATLKELDDNAELFTPARTPAPAHGLIRLSFLLDGYLAAVEDLAYCASESAPASSLKARYRVHESPAL